jgi:3-oxoacyl-[acyl-carrier protein] reductase
MNRTALITGGARGIGRGIAIELAARGWNIAVNYKSNEAAAEEAQRLCEQAAGDAGKKIRVEPFRADVSDSAARQRLVHELQERYEVIDLLVNNAGIAPKIRADLLEATEESFDEMIRVNVKGAYFLTQALAKWMIAERAEGHADYRPKIVTISSISAYTPSVNRGDYCISKAALSMLTPLYASRLAEHGINVYEIRPGIIETDMTAGVKAKYDDLIGKGLAPINRWGQPDDVAKAVAAIAEDLLPFSTGEVINVDGGFHLHRL